MIARPVLGAHQMRKIGHGQSYLAEREWLSDGRVMQRMNDGRQDVEGEWRQLGRWSDLDAERAKIARERWELD